jgi:hypothetical protein
VRAAVERITDCTVAAFHSSTQPEHELTVLLFMFAPVARSPESAGWHRPASGCGGPRPNVPVRASPVCGLSGSAAVLHPPSRLENMA